MEEGRENKWSEEDLLHRKKENRFSKSRNFDFHFQKQKWMVQEEITLNFSGKLAQRLGFAYF